MNLYTLEELQTSMNAVLVGKKIKAVKGVSIDSRTIKQGDVFFAIEGEVHDGHNFIEAAIKAKAALCVVAKNKIANIKLQGSFLVVENTLSALQDLAKFSRKRSKAKIIAITGSVGKTTTKEMLKLSLGNNVHASQASYNNHWGVPLSLAKMPPLAKFGIFEIGMNHAGEITPLVKMVKPHVALLNNVFAVHLAAFKNVKQIALAKAEIFEGLSVGGSAVLNKDSQWFELLEKQAKEKQAKIITFGEAKDSTAKLLNVKFENNYSFIEMQLGKNKFTVKVKALGFHIAKNITAILAVLFALNVDIKKCLQNIQSMQAIGGRGKIYKLRNNNKSFILIDESYNANPTSMKSALDLLGQYPTNAKRIAVLGDMLEMGSKAKQFHIAMKQHLLKNKIDKVFLVGADMKALHNEMAGKSKYGEGIEAITPAIMQAIATNDIIMVKASAGMKFSYLIEAFMQTYNIEKE